MPSREMSPNDPFDQWDKKASELERNLNRGIITGVEPRVTLEAKKQASLVLNALEGHRANEIIATIPLIGDRMRFSEKDMRVDNKLWRLDQRMAKLPPIGRLGIDESVRYDLVLELGRRFRLLPRRYPDHYLFKEKLINHDSGEITSIIYNIIRMRTPGLPKHTYWHELFLNYEFGGGQFVGITVNKNFSRDVTTGLITQLGNKVYKVWPLNSE